MNRSVPFLIIATVLLAGVLAVWFLSRRSSQKGGPPNDATPTQASEPSGAQPPHVRGNASAPVTLEEFADFQCGACGAYYPELKKLESDFGSRLRVVFRENPLVPNHQFGLIAAQAAEAAGLQGEDKFWAMHDKLYENQKTWSEAKDVIPTFVDYAKQIGIDPDRFMRDMNGEAVAVRIFQDGKRSHGLGVNSTPTFYVNGKLADGENWKPEGLREMIKQAAGGAG
jgi:protein-disulfide isomerase